MPIHSYQPPLRRKSRFDAKLIFTQIPCNMQETLAANFSCVYIRGKRTPNMPRFRRIENNSFRSGKQTKDRHGPRHEITTRDLVALVMASLGRTNSRRREQHSTPNTQEIQQKTQIWSSFVERKRVSSLTPIHKGKTRASRFCAAHTKFLRDTRILVIADYVWACLVCTHP